MNYIRHLNAFFDKVAIDKRLNPTHISLYMALFQYWNANRFQNPISISRNEMMCVSKINAKATYHKVIKELHEFGLIVYRPSFNPFRGSEVELVQWQSETGLTIERIGTSSENEQAVNVYSTKISTATVPLNEPPYKHINNTNIACATSSRFEHVDGQDKKIIRQPKNGTKEKTIQQSRPLSLEEVTEYFLMQKSTGLEAEKFYNYFQSNGWKVGGRAPMKDWEAAARNWILNGESFQLKRKATNLHTSTVKNYGEPL